MRAFRAAEKGYTNDKPSTGYDSVKPTKTGAGKSGNGEQKAQLAYDLDQYRKYSEAIVNTYGNSEKIMEAMRANGLVDEAQYYASKLAFVKINSEQKQTALEQEIARMQQEKFVGKDAATEKLNNDRKVLDSQAKIEKIKEDALATTRVIEIQQTAAINKTAKAYRDAEDAAKSYLDSLQRAQGRELGGMGLGNQERGRLAGRAQIEDKYDQDRRSLEKTKRDAMASDTFGGDAKAKYDNELERINRFKTDALGSYDEYFQSRLEKERNFQTGASEAMNNYLTDVGNVAKQSENLFTKAFKGMEDALVNFAKTGKLDFKSLADSIISDMIRMQIQQSIMKPLSQAMSGGGGFGGLIGGIAGLFGGGGGFSPMGGAGGSMGGGGDFGLGSVNPASGEYFGSLEFDGGGYTGSGSRSGGLDGKGGFMAMMHPQETVIDHSKGQAIPGGQAGTSNTVNVTLSNNITVAGGIGSGEAYAAIQKALAENNRQWTEQLKRQGVLA